MAAASQVHAQLQELQAELADTTAALEEERARLRDASTARGAEATRLRAEAEEARGRLEGLAAAHEEQVAEMELQHKRELEGVKVGRSALWSRMLARGPSRARLLKQNRPGLTRYQTRLPA